MTRAYKQFENNETIRYYVFYALLILIIVNAVFYLFFINLGVSEILLKKERLVRLADLKEKNQILYGKYLEKFKTIDLETAYSLGYVDAKTAVFVKRSAIVAKN